MKVPSLEIHTPRCHHRSPRSWLRQQMFLVTCRGFLRKSQPWDTVSGLGVLSPRSPSLAGQLPLLSRDHPPSGRTSFPLNPPKMSIRLRPFPRTTETARLTHPFWEKSVLLIHRRFHPGCVREPSFLSVQTRKVAPNFGRGTSEAGAPHFHR